MEENTLREIFKRNLKKLMEARNLSQAEMATGMNITPSTVSDWCSGKVYPRAGAMQRIAEFLETPINSLIADEQDTCGETLTSRERVLINIFRSADARAQQDAMMLLETHQRFY